MKSILIVEDDPIGALVVSKFLQNDYSVHVAGNGREALELLNEKPVDAILMDINLGDEEYDGIQVLHTYSDNPKLKHIPSIAVTAYAMSSDRKKFLDEGFAEYIPKPVDKDLLLTRLKKILKD